MMPHTSAGVTETTPAPPTATPSTGVWMVSDLSQPVPYGPHEPEFGPFADEAAAKDFAAKNPHYWAHDVSGGAR